MFSEKGRPMCVVNGCGVEIVEGSYCAAHAWENEQMAKEARQPCAAVRHCEHAICCHCKALNQMVKDCRDQGFPEYAIQAMKDQLLRRAI